MKIDISPIKGAKGATLPLDFALVLEDVPEAGCVVRFEEPARVSGRLTNIGDCIMLTGEVQAAVEMLCDRCVESFEFRVSAKLEYGYVDSGRPEGQSGRRTGRARSKKDADSDQDFRYYEGEEIDAAPEIREAVLLALPGKRLCSTECKGICPHCGANRNRSECSCSDDPVDPRLAELSRLLSE